MSNPKTKPVLVTDVSTFIFSKRAKLSGYFRISDGQLWWNDGMQSSIVGVVHIFTDDIEGGIYCGYCAMIHQDYFKLLARLKDGDDFTEEARKVLATWKL